MYDPFKREINYLRVSVTDLCNLRCAYCMPAGGVPKLPRKSILTFEEIRNVVEVGARKGISKVRLTGGEPLARKGIVELVRMIANIEGINDFAMSTNGIFLDHYARELKEAGLHRVNISLDTLSPLHYKQITRRGDINKVFAGIEAAQKVGLEPIKLNCVIEKSTKEKDASDVAEFARQNGLQVRFIHQMHLAGGVFSVVEGGEGGNCKSCNRLRLTPDGYINPCLFSDLQYNVREYGIEKAYDLAVTNKPEYGTTSLTNQFYKVGG